ncbi:MAG: PEP-CTERM sorting domain-containing protein [Burkholderiales bacterium]
MLKHCALATGLAVAALSSPLTEAKSIKLTFDYMATNLKGDFASASGGVAVPVAELFLTDLADLGKSNPDGGAGGVQAAFRILPNGLSQFSNGTGSRFVSAFELNFPDTSACANATCSATGTINGYDTDANGGFGNHWVDVHGVPLTGGIEWAENGNANGWGAGTTDPSFGQELNWGNTGAMHESAGLSIIDVYSAAGRDDVSVDRVLGHPVSNTTAGLPGAYSWIKVRSNNSAIAGDRGIATDQWWGTPNTSGAGANQRWQLNVLATSYEEVPLSAVPVPEPSEYAMLATGLAMLGLLARRRSATAAKTA